MKMRKFTGPEAIQILKSTYKRLSGIDVNDLTEFESHLLQKIADYKPTSDECACQRLNSEAVANIRC